eukprot:11183319-Prorocentrum_lima.AAC.1
MEWWIRRLGMAVALVDGPGHYHTLSTLSHLLLPASSGTLFQMPSSSPSPRTYKCVKAGLCILQNKWAHPCILQDISTITQLSITG